jgi:nucleosome binding factor SPN SPT16 subunit
MAEDEIKIDKSTFEQHLGRITAALKSKKDDTFGGANSLLCVLGRQVDDQAPAKTASLHVSISCRLSLTTMFVC